MALNNTQGPASRPADTHVGPVGATALSTAWLVMVLAVAGAFALGVLWPYYANDLDAVPRGELISGAHDPKDLWPTVGGPRWLIELVLPAAILPALLLPPSCLLSVLALLAARRRRHRSAAVVLTAVVVVSVVATAVMLVGYGGLTAWMLD